MTGGRREKNKDVWWHGGLYFSCLQCGACCGREPGSVSFTDRELEAMSDELGISTEEFLGSWAWEKYGVLSLREQLNFDCVFLHTDNGRASCKIYAVRPSQCSAFPFWPDLLGDKFLWDSYALSCPGMNHGEFHGYDEINRILAKHRVGFKSSPRPAGLI
ncbi:MAG: YkgJ family cysteine cluster protein [Synergistaceae bacterium]|jgi:Fe-S-cluster containining protein|nr:YkgJ family cysteine cluster protein [Synergistaceae bacterium]